MNTSEKEGGIIRGRRERSPADATSGAYVVLAQPQMNQVLVPYLK